MGVYYNLVVHYASFLPGCPHHLELSALSYGFRGGGRVDLGY